ncbi:EexN family lipoprotein, partial [Salmonella enterica]|nr:EexN family lipoprotein [Salmonella enterica]
MKKMGFVLVVATSIILLNGCKEEVKSYAWYSEHQDETYDVYKKCKESGEG